LISVTYCTSCDLMIVSVADIVFVACWTGDTELELPVAAEFNADDDILAARNLKRLTAGATVAVPVVSPLDALAPARVGRVTRVAMPSARRT